MRAILCAFSSEIRAVKCCAHHRPDERTLRKIMEMSKNECETSNFNLRTTEKVPRERSPAQHGCIRLVDAACASSQPGLSFVATPEMVRDKLRPRCQVPKLTENPSIRYRDGLRQCTGLRCSSRCLRARGSSCRSPRTTTSAGARRSTPWASRRLPVPGSPGVISGPRGHPGRCDVV